MPKRKPLKKAPDFGSEDEERSFWAHHESSDYIDWEKAQRVTMPYLKPSTKTISIRLPEALLANLKVLAHKRDIHYHALVKIFLTERVLEELNLGGQS